ncbi:MAG TPA: ATP-binding protein [Acidimicrobiales bacterium]|nr:ATP-binding protein [Acidimicrobiales bacterium]
MPDNNTGPKLQRYARVASVFTPGAPIDSLALFADRPEQVIEVLNAVSQKGQHVVLFGERGVGKTSLANVLSEIFTSVELFDSLSTSHINCNTTDDFPSLWRRIFQELGLDVDYNILSPAISPEDVRTELERLQPRGLVVIDELDRLEDDEALSLLADTIKTLSDHIVRTTLVLVGVADSIDQLIGDHASVERPLVQVPMPRMSHSELCQIVDKGLAQLDMAIDPSCRDRIARLSEGLPHYTHALSLHAAQRAVMDDRSSIEPGDVDSAIRRAVDKAQQSIRSSHQKATRSPRRKNLFPNVLLACALAPKDDLGFFTAGGVKRPMTAIMNQRYDIPAFARHLDEFTKDVRGSVLEKTGEPRRYFYRFRNPLLQPFTILDGLAKDLVSESLVKKLQREEATLISDDPTAPERLL